MGTAFLASQFERIYPLATNNDLYGDIEKFGESLDAGEQAKAWDERVHRNCLSTPNRMVGALTASCSYGVNLIPGCL